MNKHEQWEKERDREYQGYRRIYVDAAAASYRLFPEDHTRALLTYLKVWQENSPDLGLPHAQLANQVLTVARKLAQWDKHNPEPSKTPTVEEKAAEFARHRYYAYSVASERENLAKELVRHLREDGHIIEETNADRLGFKFAVGQRVKVDGCDGHGVVRKRTYVDARGIPPYRVYEVLEEGFSFAETPTRSEEALTAVEA